MTTREFSFKQELLLEKGAAVIGDYMRYENKMNLNDVQESYLHSA